MTIKVSTSLFEVFERERDGKSKNVKNSIFMPLILRFLDDCSKLDTLHE